MSGFHPRWNSPPTRSEPTSTRKSSSPPARRAWGSRRSTSGPGRANTCRRAFRKTSSCLISINGVVMTVTAAGPTEPDRPDLPVVMIGGGPVGLALAMELHHHGVGCPVGERRLSVPAVRPRAKPPSARTMELFRRWGFAERIRARAPIPVSWSSDVVFCTTAAGAEGTRFTGTLGLDLARDDLVAEPGQQVGQPVVEQALRDPLAQLPDVRLRFGSRATGVDQDPDGVTVQVEDADGAASAIRARYAVGADGA